ncbi:MAG: UDP-3-O-acyl-N-acetylglucosamine deacetylase [Bacteroidales bacterium]
MSQPQQTLKKEYTFEGKGLHTGKIGKMTVKPAPEDSGICFRRIDMGGAEVRAVAENVSSTARSTTLSQGEASVATIEHIMSALTGMGVDNALIDIDNVEVPILDGSARFYAEAFRKDGLAVQASERKYITIPKTIEVKDENSGAYVKIEPSDSPSYDLTVDFNSRVLGVQSAHWNLSEDYASQIAPCRTFVFFHEIEYLFQNNLIKGGDVDNAIVIVEHPVNEEQLSKLSHLFNMPMIKVNDNGYLNNLDLHFPNECGRHKLLDLIGDMRLVGGYVNAKITGFKSGHTINTNAAKAVSSLLK